MPTEISNSSYFANQYSVAPYQPFNDDGIASYCLIGPRRGIASRLEVVLGVMKKDSGTLTRCHADMDQLSFMLEGTACAEVSGESHLLGPGACCFFPAGERHAFTATSDIPVRVLEIFSPPDGKAPGTVTAPEADGPAGLEVVLGVIEKGTGDWLHSHPGIEQANYVIEGSARAEVGGETFLLGPGDCCFFPAGERHAFAVTSDLPARVVVIFSPPHCEVPENTRKG